MEKTEKKTKSIIPQREPDIAFWFDEEDETMYVVKIKEGILHIQLLQACFDLMAKTLRADEQTKIGEFSE